MDLVTRLSLLARHIDSDWKSDWKSDVEKKKKYF